MLIHHDSLLETFDSIVDYLNLLPEEYIAPVLRYRRVLEERKNNNLFYLISSILIFITEKENVKKNAITGDFIRLHMLLFLAYGLYDEAYDSGKISHLSLANILLREFWIQLRNSLPDSISSQIEECRLAHTRTERYNSFPPSLFLNSTYNQDEIEDKYSRVFEVQEGFDILIVLFNIFIEQTLPASSGQKWKTFFTTYLVERQILDDLYDFVEDYRDGQLKSFGIYCLGKMLGEKNYSQINLKNPFFILRYKFYVLRELSLLHDKFYEDYLEYLKIKNVDTTIYLKMKAEFEKWAE